MYTMTSPSCFFFFFLSHLIIHVSNPVGHKLCTIPRSELVSYNEKQQKNARDRCRRKHSLWFMMRTFDACYGFFLIFSFFFFLFSCSFSSFLFFGRISIWRCTGASSAAMYWRRSWRRLRRTINTGYGRKDLGSGWTLRSPVCVLSGGVVGCFCQRFGIMCRVCDAHVIWLNPLGAGDCFGIIVNMAINVERCTRCWAQNHANSLAAVYTEVPVWATAVVPYPRNDAIDGCFFLFLWAGIRWAFCGDRYRQGNTCVYAVRIWFGLIRFVEYAMRTFLGCLAVSAWAGTYFLFLLCLEFMFRCCRVL